MPRKQSTTLTGAELRIMDVLWQKGPGTVQQVLDWLPAKPALAYNSVLTTVRILERKGYVQHIKNILEGDDLEDEEVKRLREMLERSQAK